MAPREAELRCQGGPGPFEVPISTSNLHHPDLEAVQAYSRPIFEEPGRAGLVVEALEARLCEYHQAQSCVAFASGFWALVFALVHQARPDRDEVLIPSFTYRRLADVVHWAGKTPVFIDVGEDLAMSVEATRGAVGDRTSLILAVHPIVNCCDAQGFLELADQAGTPLIFDAVESVHETAGGRRVGSFGAPEVFSLHASKLVNGLEGGYVCTEDASVARELRAARDGGLLRRAGARPWPALNARMADGHAAFTLAELDALEQNVAHNQEIYRAYGEALAGVDGIRLHAFDEGEQTSFKNVVVRVEDTFPVTRDQVVRFLNGERVLARAHYDPPLHRKPTSYRTEQGPLEQSEQVRTRYLNLPCGARVGVEDVRVVCELLALLARAPHLAEATP